MATAERAQRRTDRPAASDILNRQMPCSLEAERAVLCSLILLPEVSDEVALVLRADDFYDDANARLYKHMMALHDEGRPLDVTLLVQRLRDAGEFEAIGGTAYLADLSEAVATAAHAEYYAKIVHDKATLRALITASTDILQEAYEPSVEARQMLSRAEEKVFAILENKGQGNFAVIRDVLQASLARIDARMKQDHAFGGVETGYDEFDEMTGGMHDSELIILAARPSMGKTALALNIVEHVAIDCQKPTLFVSLEMSALELGDRLLCSLRQGERPRVAQRQDLRRKRRRKLMQTAAEVSSGAAVHRRFAQPHDDRNRRLGPAAETQRWLGADRDRLFAAHRAGQFFATRGKNKSPKSPGGSRAWPAN